MATGAEGAEQAMAKIDQIFDAQPQGLERRGGARRKAGLRGADADALLPSGTRLTMAGG